MICHLKKLQNLIRNSQFTPQQRKLVKVWLIHAILWSLPTTIFRFLQCMDLEDVQMALFKFVSAILEERTIDIYNNGEMYRDFTYVEDLVLAIRKLIDVSPKKSNIDQSKGNDSLSPVAPYRIVNIGNSKKIKLLDFINVIEKTLNKKAIRNYMPMQLGDVPQTWADTSLLNDLIGYLPETDYHKGIEKFIEWYRTYYKI